MERSELIQKALQELDVPVPRRLRIRSVFQTNVLEVAAFGFFGFFIFFSNMFYDVMVPVLAYHFGTPAQAKILDLWARMGRGMHYHVGMEYKNGSEMVVGATFVQRSLYQGLHVGQIISIHYLPWFTGKPVIENPSIFNVIAFIAFLSIVSLLFVRFFKIAILLPIPGIKAKMFKQRKLLILGQAVKCKIHRLESKSCYGSFEIGSRRFDVQTSLENYGCKNQVNDEVVVVYNPEKPDENGEYDPSNWFWIPVKD